MSLKNDYFQTMCNLARAFGTAHNRHELLDLILQSALDTLRGKAACLYLAEPGKDALIPLAQKGLSAGYFRSRKSLLSRSIMSIVEKEGFLFIGDAAQDPQLEHPEAKKAEGIASILAVPVKVKGRHIGIFCLFTADPRDFTAKEQEFLTILAQQAGGVMEHARLIDELRKKTKLFFDLAVNLGASLEVKEILHSLSTEIAQALGVKGASIRLLDETRQTLELVASYGLSEKYLQKGPVSAKKSIAQALNRQQPVIILNAATDRRVQYRQMNKEEGIVSILSVPIKTKEKVIGVLRLYSGVKREFTPDEILLVIALAYLGGLAIQNASLYLMCQKDMKDLKEELWSHRSWF